jgi:phosphoribosylformimino-5-aminoimidazole carboxamide ribotide isomerase
MLLIPAIDLFAGRVVRLTQGDYQRLEVYHDDPLRVAKQLEDEGAPMLHVVDLEGARAGEPRNLPSVASIVRSVRIPVQVGGGIRTLEVLRRYLDLGVAFPVVGSVVVKDPETFAEMLKVGGERLTVSLDVRDGVLAVSGWTEETSLRASDLARELHERGVTRFILTDVTRDGTLEGVGRRKHSEVHWRQWGAGDCCRRCAGDRGHSPSSDHPWSFRGYSGEGALYRSDEFSGNP